MGQLYERSMRYAIAAFAACAFGIADAQVTNNYVDTTVGALGNPGQPCNGALTRTISVPDSVTITDVDLGMIIDHDNRGDTAAALRSPAGTQITIYFQSGGTANDYNVVFDQDAANEIDNGPQAGNNDSTAAPYQFDIRPRAAVSMDAFNGENSQGDWIFLACDNSNNGIDGQYIRSELIITGDQPFADLNLAMVADTITPTYGSNVTLTLSVTHEAGTLSTNGVEVTVNLPAGLVYQSDNGGGSYNSATGVWTIGTMNPGDIETIDIAAEVMSSGSHATTAEITASTTNDPDSTPNNFNSNPGEDDSAGISLIPGSNGATGPFGEPSLTCAVPEIFDWDTNAWVFQAGVFTRAYPNGGSDNTDFTFAFTGDTNRTGNNSPATNTDMEGGLTPIEQSLYLWQNLNSTTERTVTEIDVGAPGVGVQELQFTIFDMDFFAGQFRDVMVVEGFLNGTSVSPVLTTGTAVTAIGDTAVGIEANDNAAAGGNVIVTFLSPVDRVEVTYENPEADAGTSNQARALHDLNYCPRLTDFGDALTINYGDASHLIRSGFYIGAASPDGEASSQETGNADGDDSAGADDEDTVDFSGLIAGFTSNLDVNVTGSGGFLQMWIDWNGDGDFNDTVDGVSEQVATDVTITGTTGTASIPVSVPASATLSQTIARLRWSSESGVASTGLASDGEVEDHAFIIGGAAQLAGDKDISIYDPSGVGLYALPGNDVIYALTISNVGDGPTDADTVVLIDVMPSEVEFYNADIDDGGPETDPVSFAQAGGAALSFNYATDVGYSDAASAPASFADCTYTPIAGYDPAVTFICFNPKGSMAAGDPDPTFTVEFRARIK